LAAPRYGAGSVLLRIEHVFFGLIVLGVPGERKRCFSVSAKKKLFVPHEIATVAKGGIAIATRHLHAEFAFILFP
jgi:hypothetical protein